MAVATANCNTNDGVVTLIDKNREEVILFGIRKNLVRPTSEISLRKVLLRKDWGARVNMVR